MTYRLPTNAMSWSSVFRQLESNKERLGIVDYSVSQTTLEQVQYYTFIISALWHQNLMVSHDIIVYVCLISRFS